MINSGVDVTLAQFQQLERAASSEQLNNWRFESALYRAYYDAYTRIRLITQTAQEEHALGALREARKNGSAVALGAAKSALAPVRLPKPEISGSASSNSRMSSSQCWLATQRI